MSISQVFLSKQFALMFISLGPESELPVDINYLRSTQGIIKAIISQIIHFNVTCAITLLILIWVLKSQKDYHFVFALMTLFESIQFLKTLQNNDLEGR